MEKMPPREKIAEAYTAISDGRVTFKEDHYEVFSSDGKKCYTVVNDEDVYYSDDNATYWQGYAGYPLIAVLMLQERLPFDKDVSDCFKDINWHELNKRYKRDYKAAFDSVIDERNLDREKIETVITEVYESLKKLDIRLSRKKLR